MGPFYEESSEYYKMSVKGEIKLVVKPLFLLTSRIITIFQKMKLYCVMILIIYNLRR